MFLRWALNKQGQLRWAMLLSPPSLRKCLLTAGIALVALLLASACNGSDPGDGNRTRVVTSIGILADITRNVGGAHVSVQSLVPDGADAHTYQATPADSLKLSRAKVIVLNGAGLDDYLSGVIDGAKSPAASVVVASAGLKLEPIDFAPVEGREPEVEDDPHFWQNPRFAVHYAEQIRDALVSADAPNAEAYRKNAQAYRTKLEALDQEIEAVIQSIPESRRHIIAFHDAFGYFAKRYGVKVSSFVGPEGGETSPRTVAAIERLIRTEKVPAVFVEPQFDDKVLQQLAKDTGVKVGTVYSDAFDKQVHSYIEMMRSNAQTIQRLLR